MKKTLSLFLVAALLTSSLRATDPISVYETNTEELWNSGPHDDGYAAASTSMLGWGIGLAIGIAVLAATLSQGD